MPLEVFGHGTVPLTLLNDEFGMCADYSDGTVHPDRQITRGTCHSGGGIGRLPRPVPFPASGYRSKSELLSRLASPVPHWCHQQRRRRCSTQQFQPSLRRLNTLP